MYKRYISSTYAPTRGGYPDDDIIDDKTFREVNAITGMLPGVVEQETPQQLASFIIEMSKELSNLEEALRLEKEKTSHQADEISMLLEQIQSVSPTNSEKTRGSSSDDRTTPSSHRNRSPSSSVRGLKSPSEIIKQYGIDESTREALNKSPLLATRSRRQRVADMFMSMVQAMRADSPDHTVQQTPPKTISSEKGVACMTPLDYSAIFKECIKAVQLQVAPTMERRWLPVN